MATSRPIDSEALRINWLRPSIKGCLDLFDYGEFDEECADVPREHTVRCPDGWEGRAKYRLTVDGSCARLDYAAFAKVNRKRGMDPGIMTIVFDDADRVRVRGVLWQDAYSDEPTDAPVGWTDYAPGAVEPYTPKGAKSKRRRRDVRDRPGQRLFRARLRRAYGDTCCLTGCAVAAALEAAHIDQHINEWSDAPSNGLLFRGDLHRLFDADLLGIDPSTSRACLSTTVTQLRGYEAIAEGAVLRPPRKGFASYGPASAALERRWEQFKAAESRRTRLSS